jgi:hypothetical protein
MGTRAIRVGVYVLAGFVAGSLILGTLKGNSFIDNLVYGLWTGAIAGAVVGLVVRGVSAVRGRH